MSRKNWEGYFDAVRKQQWRTALDILNHIAATEKDNPLVYLRMGDVCRRLGDTPGAVKAYHLSAHIQILAGFQHKALALYKIILRISPDDAEALSRSSSLLKELESTRTTYLPQPEAIEPQQMQEKGIAASEAAPYPLDSAADLDAAVIGGTGLTSIDGHVSSLSEEGLQKTLDDLMIPISERQYAGSAVPEIFEGMSEEETNALLAGFETKTYPDRAVVIEEGDSGDSLFMIKSGAARVVAHMFGREIELARLGEGDLFGEVAFLTGRPRTASVIAEGPLEAYEINRLDVEQLIERNPEFMSRLEGFYETRVRDTIKKVLPK